MTLATALGLLGAGCAQTHTIAVPVADADLAKMQSKLNGKEGATAYFDGEPQPGASAARPRVIGGTIYVDPFVVRMVDGGKERSIPHSQVSMIQYVDYQLGAGQGLAIGLGVGVLLGGAVGYVAGEDCSSQAILCFDRPRLAGGLAVTLGVIGMLAGAIAGGSTGAINDWVFGPVDKR